MANTPDGQDLIQAFFAALELRHLEQCEAVVSQLRSLAHTQLTYEPWCVYFSGILANERDHDWAEAERIFSRLLAHDLDLPLRGRVLLALGRTYEYQGRWNEAIGTYEQSLPVFAALSQPIDQVKVWKQIAISYNKGFAQGDFGPQALQRAIQYCRSALDLLEPIANPSPDIVWLEGSVWSTLGATHMHLGQWNEALACYEQDLAICEALDDRHGIGVSYLNLGEIHQRLGRDRWPEALSAYHQALSLIREFHDRYLEADVLANLGFLHQEMDQHEPALDYYNQAIELIEDLRATVSSEAARAGFFATAIDTYANAVLLCLAAGREAQAFDYVERARARAFLDTLATGSSELPRAVEATPLTLAEVQAALPADALLLEYFTTGLVEAREGRAATPGALRHRFPPARTLLLAVTCDTIQVQDAGLSPNDLRPSRLNSVVERHFLQPAIRRTLYDRLIAPVAELLQDRRRIYIVPHGPLHYIPFQALIATDGGTLLRAAGPQLVHAPSATFLFREGQPAPGRTSWPCLALGYNGAGAERLRFAEEEARSINRLIGGDILVGPSPKKATLYDQAAQYRLLHLSCHGSFDPQSPLASALQLAPEEAMTALDVLNHLHLRCDLVTLSACESGLSRVRRGDELDGFVRAFLYAGAPALICTLWRVDERSTHILMARLYQEIQAGTGFAEALKRAQLYLMSLTAREVSAVLQPTVGLMVNSRYREAGMLPEQADEEPVFADPFYWAPFILIGVHEAV